MVLGEDSKHATCQVCQLGEPALAIQSITDRACYKAVVHRIAASVLASVAWAAPARAERFSLHATATVDAAATDNVAAGSGSRDPDVFFTARPGVLFTYALPRMIHEINAELELMRYAVHGDLPAVAFRGAWKAMVLPGPRSELIFQADVSQSLLSAISAATSPAETMVQLQPIQPQAGVNVRQGSINEYGAYTATREVRLSQTLFAHGSKSDDNGAPETIVASWEAGAAFGIDRSFRSNSLSFETGASVLRLQRRADPGALLGPRLDRQINPRASVRWRHDFGRRLSGSLDGGLAVVIPYGVDPDNPDVKRHLGTFPVVGGQLAYTDVWGLSTLSVRHDVAPNLFVAANTVNDTAAIAAAVPLYWFDDTRRRQPRLAGVGFVRRRAHPARGRGDVKPAELVHRRPDRRRPPVRAASGDHVHRALRAARADRRSQPGARHGDPRVLPQHDLPDRGGPVPDRRRGPRPEAAYQLGARRLFGSRADWGRAGDPRHRRQRRRKLTPRPG